MYFDPKSGQVMLDIVDGGGRPIPAASVSTGFDVSALEEFEGAAAGRRMSDWGLSSSGPNSSLFSSLSSLRSRSRALTRNFSLGAGAIDAWVANLIGTGISPRWRIKDKVLKEEIQELWSDWVEESDIDGICSFYGQQALGARAMIDAGEYLARFITPPPENDLIVPLQIQLLEADHLDHTYNDISAETGNRIRMGIEIDDDSRRAAYHLWPYHPGEQLGFEDTNLERIRVPASEIMHVYRPLRIGQLRGRPWMAPAIIKMHEIDQCDDAELVRRKTTAMFGGFIKRTIDAQPGGSPLPQLGRTGTLDANSNKVIELEPGTFPKLPLGWDVVFSEPHDVAGSYIDWMKQQMRHVARAMGLTYDQLTGDLEGVTYTSLRAGLLEFRRLCRQIQLHTLAFQFCRVVARRWINVAVISGAIDIPGFTKKRRIYYRVSWRPDGWDWVDPVKDQKAEVIAVRAGFKSRSAVVAEGGEDVEKVDVEQAEDKARADAAGLVHDTDPSKTSAAGAYQETSETEKTDE